MEHLEGGPSVTDGIKANRRGILRTATGLAAAAVVGGAVADSDQVVVAQRSSRTAIRMRANFADVGQFDVLAFSWGLSNTGTAHPGTGGGAGKTEVQDIVITKPMDVSSPKLQFFTANGRHLATGAITATDSRGNSIFTYELEDILVVGVSIGVTPTDDQITENVTFSFSKVRLTFGASSFSWDIGANEGSLS